MSQPHDKFLIWYTSSKKTTNLSHFTAFHSFPFSWFMNEILFSLLNAITLRIHRLNKVEFLSGFSSSFLGHFMNCEKIALGSTSTSPKFGFEFTKRAQKTQLKIFYTSVHFYNFPHGSANVEQFEIQIEECFLCRISEWIQWSKSRHFNPNSFPNV